MSIAIVAALTGTGISLVFDVIALHWHNQERKERKARNEA